MKNDLRARRRMPTAHLKSSIRVSKGFIDSIWEEVRPNDFSLFGMKLKTNRAYKANDKITLSLNLQLDMGTISIEKITARIVRVNKLVGFYEYGVEFDKKVVGNIEGLTAMNLLRIENILDKQELLSVKITQKIA